jgi:hypothetical protein
MTTEGNPIFAICKRAAELMKDPRHTEGSALYMALAERDLKIAQTLVHTVRDPYVPDNLSRFFQFLAGYYGS